MRYLRKFNIILLVILTFNAKAQITEPRWEIISSQNFDLYLPKSSDVDYYRLLNDAEKHLNYCEGLFDIHLNESIRLVLSKNENIVKIPVSNNNSKSTEVEFDRHTGYIVSNTEYEEILLKVKNSIVAILFNDLMYGKSFQDRIQNNALLQVQNWFMKGLAAYCNEPWTGNYDGMLREYFRGHDSPGFNLLIEQNETLAGYSFWKFIMEQYGEQNMANTLFISHLSRSIESGLYFVYGKNLPQLMKEWQLYYKVIYGDEFKNNSFGSHSLVSNSENLEKISISPDGRWLAGIRHEDFKTKIYCLNLKNKNRTLINTSEGNSDIILRWRVSGKSNELLYNISTASTESIVFYNPSKNRNTRYQNVRDFDRLLNFDIDAQNNYLFYGVKKSKTYLLFYNGKTQELKTLSSGTTIKDVSLFDGNAFFVVNSGFDNNSKLIRYDGTFDTLLILKGISVFKILNIDTAKIFYVSNPNGLNQVYQYQVGVKSLKVLTDFTHNALSVTSSKWSENCYYTIGNFPETKTANVTLHEYDTSESPVTFYTLNPKGKVMNILKIVSEPVSGVAPDTVAETNKKYYFINGFTDENGNEYQHLLDSIKQAQRENKINLSYLKNYELNFATLKVSMLQLDNSSFFNMIDLAPLSPNGIHSYYYYQYLKAEIALKDILNKYQLFGGFRLSTNLGGGYDAYFKFEKNYKRYTLLASVYYYQKRNIVVAHENVLKQQIQSTTVSYNFKYSNTVTLKFGGSVMPFSNTILSTERSGLIQRSSGTVVGALNTEFQYYCLKKYNDFLYRGLSLQIQPSVYYNHTTSHINSFIKGILKYYKPLYRRIIWSNQLLVNTSQGNDKVVNIIGGAESWIFMRYNEQNQLLRDVNYQLRMYGGAIRGFRENVRNGNNSFCLNSELRIPVSTFFSKWPTDKFWYQKLILIPFADLGSAWNGFNLFDRSNNYTIRVFDYSTAVNNIASVEVKSQRNPFVGSIGCGLNTRIIGYNLRLDAAIGIEDGVMRKPMYMLSYGTNF